MIPLVSPKDPGGECTGEVYEQEEEGRWETVHVTGEK